jgi:hypothetical protein
MFAELNKNQHSRTSNPVLQRTLRGEIHRAIENLVIVSTSTDRYNRAPN